MIEFEIKGGGLDRIAGLMGKFPKGMIEEFKKAVLYTETVIKKDFMIVQDGGRVNNRYPKRTKFPGVRAVTGTLRRNVKSRFQVNAGELEGAIGTSLFYGGVLERNEKYEYLKPGLEKAKPEIQRMLKGYIQGVFRE